MLTINERFVRLPAHHFIALIHKEPGSGYGVTFPDVPGVITVADSLDEALSEAGAVLAFAFEDLPGTLPLPRSLDEALTEASEVLAFAFEDWQGALPHSRSLDELRSDPDFVSASADAVIAAVRPRTELVAAA